MSIYQRTFERPMSFGINNEEASFLIADTSDPPTPRRPWDKFSDLAAAILQGAVNDYLAHAWAPKGPTKTRLRADAKRWLDGEIECFYTFELVCDLLGLNASATRKKIYALGERPCEQSR